MVYHRGTHVFTEAERRLAGAIADEVAFAVDRKIAALERERLLGIVGHDLRNPLNAIGMSVHKLLREDVSEGVARSVRRIATSAERMERLITQLLHFAQARHAGGIPMERRPSDLDEIARHVVEELEAAFPEREISFHSEGILAGEWDADRLGEVLSNLVGNALQHGGEEPVAVRLRGVDDEDVLAEVHNAGAPIPAALLPHLFDPFRRGVSSSAERSNSVGLGLFISREIVRAHGGMITVTSTADRGTSFFVQLPRALGAARASGTARPGRS
jgi:signal transduction histidine kinase